MVGLLTSSRGRQIPCIAQVIQNQSDSIYYQNVHGTWVQALRRMDKSKGTVVRVLDVQQQDVTSVYVKWLGERNQAIRHLLAAFDYGYLVEAYREGESIFGK